MESAQLPTPKAQLKYGDKKKLLTEIATAK